MSDAEQIEETLGYEPIFIARQPIFDQEQHIWGYELLFRKADTSSATIDNPDAATAQVIADGFTLAMNSVSGKVRMLVNFPKNLILRGSAMALPKKICAVEVLETVEPTPEIIEALKKLKNDGYMLCLDDFVGQEGYEEILAMADVVKVDVLGMERSQIVAVTEGLQQYDVKLLAEKVEDHAVFQLCKLLGYSYFQGYYFQKPEVLPGRKISMSAITRLRLLSELANPDYDVKNLSRTIGADISLSYRLLTYINSAAMAFTQKIKSLQQAVTILGSNPLRQWLMVVIISDMAPNPRSMEMAFLSVKRARFMEVMASIMSHPPYSSETMFLLGLFSRLDALLNQKMAEILDHMPLEEDIKGALLGEPNPALEWLRILDALDDGELEKVEKSLGEFGVDAEEAARQHAQAMNWTRDILSMTDSSKLPKNMKKQAEEQEYPANQGGRN